MNKGVIKDLKASWNSGLATLVMEGGTNLHADNGPLMRALDSMFPGFIRAGHVVDVSQIRGKEILYALDDMGLTLEYIGLPEEEV